MSKTQKLFITLIAMFLTSTYLPTSSKEAKEKEIKALKQVQEKKEEIKTSIKWTESLRLKDFYLSPSYSELKDKSVQYKDVLQLRYKETPDVFSVAIEYGLILIDLNKLQEAEIVFNKAVKDFNTNLTPKVYKAWVDACNGKYQSAKDTWLSIAKDKVNFGIFNGMWLPHDIDAILGLELVKDFLQEKDKQEVEQTLNEIVSHFANNPKFAAIIISDDLKAGRIEEAKEKLTKI